MSRVVRMERALQRAYAELLRSHAVDALAASKASDCSKAERRELELLAESWLRWAADLDTATKHAA